MEKHNKPRPSRADWERLKELEGTENGRFSGEYFRLWDAFDWSPEVIEENGSYGIRLAVGEVILPPLFEDLGVYVNVKKGDRVAVKQNGKWGVVVADGTGKHWIVEPRFDWIGFPNPLTPVKKGDKWGVYDLTKNRYLVPPECDSMETAGGYLFTNGTAICEKDGKYGLITDAGLFTGTVFDDIDNPPEEPVKVKYKGVWGWLNEKGRFTTDEDEAAITSD